MQTLLLLRPYWQSMRNRLLSNSTLQNRLQLLVVAILGVLMMILLYRGTNILFSRLAEIAQLVYLPVSHFLGLFFVFFLFMLLASNLSLVIGIFYFSNDTDLLSAAPVKPHQFFISRILLAFIGTAWMPSIFLFPLLLGISKTFATSAVNIIYLYLACLPFFLIPTGLAFILATVILVILPKYYRRILALSFLALVALFVVYLPGIIQKSSATFNSTESIVRLISIFSLPNAHWLPSNWIATALEGIMLGQTETVQPELHLLIGSACCLLSLAYLIFHYTYDLTRSKASATRHIKQYSFYTILRRALNFLPISHNLRGLLLKEWFTLVRDPAQFIQLLLLLTLGGAYLSHLDLLSTASSLGQKYEERWINFIYITHLSIQIFILVALCTRLVFPSISLEGRLFPKIVSSPITLSQILRQRMLIWTPFLLLISITFSVLGCLALNLGYWVILSNLIFSICNTYMCIGLAVGLGAYFANFEWEHSGQLAASVGSFIFMLVAVSFGALNAAIAFSLFKIDPVLLSQHVDFLPMALLIGSTLALPVIALLLVRTVLKLGVQSLRRNL